VIHSL